MIASRIFVVGTIVLLAAALMVSIQPVKANAALPGCRVHTDPLVPGAFSLFIPGLGQFMNGEDGKGLTHLVVAFVVIPLASETAHYLAPWPYWRTHRLINIVAAVTYILWAVQSAVDAYQVASWRCQLVPMSFVPLKAL